MLFSGYKGTIEMLDSNRYAVSGEVSVIGDNEIEITELPIRVWTQGYKESVMESLLHGSEKQAALINDYKEYHTDTTVRFLVNLADNQLEKAEREGLPLLHSIHFNVKVLFFYVQRRRCHHHSSLMTILFLIRCGFLMEHVFLSKVCTDYSSCRRQ